MDAKVPSPWRPERLATPPQFKKKKKKAPRWAQSGAALFVFFYISKVSRRREEERKSGALALWVPRPAILPARLNTRRRARPARRRLARLQLQTAAVRPSALATCGPAGIVSNPNQPLHSGQVLFCFVKLFRLREWRGAMGGADEREGSGRGV